MNRFRFSTVGRPRRRGLALITTVGQRTTINAVAVLFGLALLAYLATRQPLLLPLVLIIAAAGVDQTLRAHPRAEFRGVSSTTIYLFVPVLFALGAALFARDNVAGVWNLPAAAVAAVIYGLAAHAEYLTVDASPQTFPIARLSLSLVSYVTALLLFTVVFTSGLTLPAATLIVAVTSLLLTVDILRELEVQTTLLFAYAAAVAVVVAEVRWATYYLALGDLLAGGLMLVTFYVLTGLVQSYLGGYFDERTRREYAIVGVVGLVIVAGFHVLTRRV